MTRRRTWGLALAAGLALWALVAVAIVALLHILHGLLTGLLTLMGAAA